MQASKMQLRRQHTMWSLRLEMGWPAFRPVNDSIVFSSNRLMDVRLGLELARVAQEARRDLISSAWASTTAAAPDYYIVTLRELLAVDVIDRCVPYAADEDAPLVLVSTRTDESFAVGARGMIERRPGKPRELGRGRKLAAKRMRRTAAAMGDRLCERNFWIPAGGAWAEPNPDEEFAARFA